MNEIGKISCAGALVAVGLGSAFLCGPPADAPEVVHEPVATSERLQLGPLRSTADAPCFDDDGKLARQVDTRRDPREGAVILSAASENELAQPMWQPRSPESEDYAARPPRLVELDDEATPLVSNLQRAATSDDWLLKPPKISRTYGGQVSIGGSAATLASESSTRQDEGRTSAWWSQDMPRLQGLVATSPSVSSSGLPQAESRGRPELQPVGQLAGPIELDPPAAVAPSRETEANASRTPPMRTHIVSDGDTLTRLAARYLKDPSRAKEIFELNRNVLRHPELLPIGALLLIPGGPSETEADLAASDSASRMVPVGPPPVAESRPQAQLQGPTPIAASGW